MTVEKPEFKNGTYNKKCSFYAEISIGSILCIKCKYCKSFKEEDIYYLPILKEHTPIVSEVDCNRPSVQLSIF